jgi:TPR repeat protein
MRNENQRRPFVASLLVVGALVAPLSHVAGQQTTLTDPRLAEVVGHYTGTAGQVDDLRAHELLIEVAGTGDVLSQMWLARCYSRGRMLFDRDEALARELATDVIEQVRALADQDSAEAAFLMGTTYAEALGVDADKGLAAAWYHRAADLGNVLGQHNLGNAYRAGDGVTEDAGMAAYWYRQSALQGDALTAFLLGQMYERGQGVSQSPEEALHWYRAAADRGNRRAIEALARLQAR